MNEKSHGSIGLQQSLGKFSGAGTVPHVGAGDGSALWARSGLASRVRSPVHRRFIAGRETEREPGAASRTSTNN
ncbi:hypothetical protein LZ30DRAFT_708076 [Colletotrichum cereale]|nr:hypothetical protein LZ30DRAFT_708076 [Colletotrichum cereale]